VLTRSETVKWGQPLMVEVYMDSCPKTSSLERLAIQTRLNEARALRFHHKKLRSDSGDAGRHRGGLGQEILIESRSDTPTAVSFLAERMAVPGVR
jgi:hypothetical protein